MSFGRERFVAGGARHSTLKVFDLRMPGSKVYHAAKFDICSSITSPSLSKASCVTQSTCCNDQYKVPSRLDWNVFLDYRGNRKGYQVSDSPVYSLSSPSPSSPSWYAGVEDKVVQIDMVAILDQHPDPVYRCGPTKTADIDADVVAKWNPKNDALRFPAYEQKAGNISLLKQQRVGNVRGSRSDWDERWQ